MLLLLLLLLLFLMTFLLARILNRWDEEEANDDAAESAPKRVSNVEEMDVPDAVFGGLKKSD